MNSDTTAHGQSLLIGVGGEDIPTVLTSQPLPESNDRNQNRLAVQEVNRTKDYNGDVVCTIKNLEDIDTGVVLELKFGPRSKPASLRKLHMNWGVLARQLEPKNLGSARYSLGFYSRPKRLMGEHLCRAVQEHFQDARKRTDPELLSQDVQKVIRDLLKPLRPPKPKNMKNAGCSNINGAEAGKKTITAEQATEEIENVAVGTRKGKGKGMAMAKRKPLLKMLSPIVRTMKTSMRNLMGLLSRLYKHLV
ncbi:hypothetical protein CC78DRAFT_583052 [Lojkania enalia]|uniref:Uncharacterized protein n=1 Tax=Lojkania enalia TaxID=147567 RepID=A0A9P4K6M6_9PLEO|nr:hypothetical protein CC78DRAFT_583052 [Didymosphaeria enalia]